MPTAEYVVSVPTPTAEATNTAMVTAAFYQIVPITPMEMQAVAIRSAIVGPREDTGHLTENSGGGRGAGKAPLFDCGLAGALTVLLKHTRTAGIAVFELV